MNLIDVYSLTETLNEFVDKHKSQISITIKLNEAKHENLQQELFKTINNTLYGYKSENNFDIVVKNIKIHFIIK